jgi:hypothetical protein
MYSTWKKQQVDSAPIRVVVRPSTPTTASLSGRSVPLVTEAANAAIGTPSGTPKPVRRSSPTPPPLPSHPAGSSTLERERALLDPAQMQINDEPLRSLALLDEHRKEFPQGALAEERDALEIQALAKANRYAEARRAATLFRAKWPDSPLLPSVESAVPQ